MFHIVLLEPEIPANTGNIGRTCLVTGSRLHLIKPLGFRIDDRNLKRAGLDYWPELDYVVYESWEDFRAKNEAALNFGAGEKDLQSCRKSNIWMATTKARKTYCEAQFRDGDYIMFGKESAAIVLYEALRQNDFAGLQREGQLHRYVW